MINGKKTKPIIIAVAVIVVIILGIVLFSSGNDPVGDVKSMDFDEFDGKRIEGLVKSSMLDVKWTSESIGNGEYEVTVKGYSKYLFEDIKIMFSTRYFEDADEVYITIESVSFDYEVYYDYDSIVYILRAVFGLN